MAFSTGAFLAGAPPLWGGRPLTGLDSLDNHALRGYAVALRCLCPQPSSSRALRGAPTGSPTGCPGRALTVRSVNGPRCRPTPGHRGSREPAADNSSSIRPVEGPSLAASRAPRPRMCPPHGRPQAVCRSLRFANPWRFRPPRPPDGELRLAARQRALAGPRGRRQGGRPHRRAGPLRPGGDLRGSLPSRTSPARCRSRSATTGSRTRKTIESCKERDQTYDAPLFVTRSS